MGGRLLFWVNDAVLGSGLWSIGNSDAVPTLVTATPLRNSEEPIVADDIMYFAWLGGLWRSDGTEAGTWEVYVGPGVHGITESGGAVYFGVQAGLELILQRVNDNDMGSTPVRAFNLAGSSGAQSLSYMTDVDGTLYFGAPDPQYGRELWKSDGTTAGTVLAMDVAPGAASGIPSHLTEAGGVLYFFSGTQLYVLPGESPAGDYDNNRAVEGKDFLAWQRSLGSPVGFAGDGADGDGDGLVTMTDLDVWIAAFGAPENPGAVAADSATGIAAVVVDAVDVDSSSSEAPASQFDGSEAAARDAALATLASNFGQADPFEQTADGRRRHLARHGAWRV